MIFIPSTVSTVVLRIFRFGDLSSSSQSLIVTVRIGDLSFDFQFMSWYLKVDVSLSES